MTQKELQEKIKELKEKRRAVILAHNYQPPEVQDIADYVGDSLGLSQEAAKTEAEVIIFLWCSLYGRNSCCFKSRKDSNSP